MRKMYIERDALRHDDLRQRSRQTQRAVPLGALLRSAAMFPGGSDRCRLLPRPLPTTPLLFCSVVFRVRELSYRRGTSRMRARRVREAVHSAERN